MNENNLNNIEFGIRAICWDSVEDQKKKMPCTGSFVGISTTNIDDPSVFFETLKKLFGQPFSVAEPQKGDDGGLYFTTKDYNGQNIEVKTYYKVGGFIR